MCKISDRVERKFIESYEFDDIEVLTDTGWVDVKEIHKTIEYDVWVIETEGGYRLECADDHIVFDECFNEIFVKDLVSNESKIMTDGGSKLVLDVRDELRREHMYDLGLSEDSNHRFYTNGILSHNSTTLAAYVSWYVLFNEYKTAAILANKMDIAKEIFGRVQFMIENLPIWLQQGVEEWNKTSFSLENGSSIFASATSPSAIRGKTVSLLILDEFAHLNNGLAEEFIKSVFPTISSSANSKMAIVSTPKGFNHFYKIWNDCEQGLNDFVKVEGHWSENPYRTQEWANKLRKELGEVGFQQEIECSFIGSSYTLVDGKKIASLSFIRAIFESDNLEIFEKPIDSHSYVITVDTSRGRGLDYSAFSIIDVTMMPYRVVGCYKDNTISTLEYPHLIYNYARQYNDAYLLVEVNDIGEEVSNILFSDYDYENLYYTNGDKIVSSRGYPGVRTTSKVKSLGCSVLKDLIEQDQLIVNSFRIIEEFGIFVLKKKSYAADDVIINDDLMTTLWLFAWLTKQAEFQEVTNIDVRAILAKNKSEYIDNQMTPFIFYNASSDIEEPDDKQTTYSSINTLSESQLDLLGRF